MILKILLGLLAIVPFFILPNMDTREPKMVLALVGAVAVILTVFYLGQFKSVKNKWFLAFLAYLPICIFFSPKPGIALMGMPVANFWVWKASLVFVIFSLFIISIYSIDFKFSDKLLLLKIMFWCGFIMSLYMILQFFGLDQFFTLQNLPVSSLPPSAVIGGTMGHPTIVSPFVAMLIPLGLYFRKYIFVGVMIIAVCLTKSYIGIGAMVLSLIILFALRNRKSLIIFTALLLLTVSIVFINPKAKQVIINRASGRIEIWNNIIQDISKPIVKEQNNTYPFTGFSPGSFYYIFHARHPSNPSFLQAHNEYLELLYDTGIIGLVIFLGAIITLLWVNLIGLNRYRRHLLASFSCILISAGGTFILHIAPIIIYSSIIVALLSKPKQEEETECVS